MSLGVCRGRFTVGTVGRLPTRVAYGLRLQYYWVKKNSRRAANSPAQETQELLAEVSLKPVVESIGAPIERTYSHVQGAGSPATSSAYTL